MIKTIVFDLDDTLFPEHQYVISGFREVSGWLEEKYSIKDFFKVAYKIFEGGIRGTIFNIALERLGISPDDHLISELVQIYREHKPELRLHKDADWAIQFYRSIKKLGIITDGPLVTQQNKVAALEIEEYFNAIIYTDAFGRDFWKPSILPYQRIMNILDCEGDECAYIGDNPSKDFIAAKKLKWLTVNICREDGEYTHVESQEGYSADFIIDSLYNIKDIIR